MSKLTPQQRQIAIVVGGVILLYLAYRYYQGQQGGASGQTSGAVAPDTAGADFASLAGQEQSDVAALQGQNSQMFAQEQSDVAGLQGDISGLGAQEQGDVSGLTGAIAGFSDQFDQLIGGQNALQKEVSATALGLAKVSRATTVPIIQTHKGGSFYDYYVKVTGHKPPARVRANAFIYQAWKSGVKAGALARPHPSTPHPSAPHNHHVAHPNGNHAAQSHHKPATQHAPAPKPRAQPRPPTPRPKPKAPVKPKPRTVPKPSGRRK